MTTSRNPNPGEPFTSDAVGQTDLVKSQMRKLLNSGLLFRFGAMHFRLVLWLKTSVEGSIPTSYVNRLSALHLSVRDTLTVVLIGATHLEGHAKAD